jgi:hypothetical protein
MEVSIMNFFEKVDDHIDVTLSEGVLPDVDVVMEMEVPNQKPGPQHSGDEGGPKSPPAATFPWLGQETPPKTFPGACKGREYPAPMFSNQNRQYPPAIFGSASKISEEDSEVIAAVLADLEAMQSDE